MSETSVTDAKNNLPMLIHRAESGAAIHITRRGKPVAVLLSEAQYARLTLTREQPSFWEHIVEMRAKPDFEPVTLSVEEVAGWRVENWFKQGAGDFQAGFTGGKAK